MCTISELGFALVMRSLQANPVKKGWRLMSCAPPLRLPSRLERSTCSRSAIRSCRNDKLDPQANSTSTLWCPRRLTKQRYDCAALLNSNVGRVHQQPFQSFNANCKSSRCGAAAAREPSLTCWKLLGQAVSHGKSASLEFLHRTLRKNWTAERGRERERAPAHSSPSCTAWSSQQLL